MFSGEHSEQWRLPRDAGPTGVLGRARGLLEQLDEGQTVGFDGDGRGEAEHGQAVRGPSIRPRRGLTHQEAAADPQEGSGTLGHDGGEPEGPGRHDVRRAPPGRIPTDVLGPGVEDLDPVSEAQAPAGGHQVIGPAQLALHQDPGPRRRGEGTGERRQATTRAKVENDPGASTQQLGEGPGMTELVLERTLADPAEASSLGQDLEEGLSQERSRPCGGDPRPPSGWRRRRCR